MERDYEDISSRRNRQSAPSRSAQSSHSSKPRTQGAHSRNTQSTRQSQPRTTGQDQTHPARRVSSTPGHAPRRGSHPGSHSAPHHSRPVAHTNHRSTQRTLHGAPNSHTRSAAQPTKAHHSKPYVPNRRTGSPSKVYLPPQKGLDPKRLRRRGPNYSLIIKVVIAVVVVIALVLGLRSCMTNNAEKPTLFDKFQQAMPGPN